MNKGRIVIIAIVLIVIIIAGGFSYYVSTHQVEDAKVGYGSLSQNLVVDDLKNWYDVNKSAYATTLINDGDGVVNLSARIIGYDLSDDMLIFLNYSATVNLSSNLIPQDFVVKIRELENARASYDFQISYVHCENSSMWSSDRIYPGEWAPYTAYLGFTPHSNNFKISGQIIWELFDFKKVRIHNFQIEGNMIISNMISSKSIPTMVNISVNTSQFLKNGCDNLFYRVKNAINDTVNKSANAIKIVVDKYGPIDVVINLGVRLDSYRIVGNTLEAILNFSVDFKEAPEIVCLNFTINTTELENSKANYQFLMNDIWVKNASLMNKEKMRPAANATNTAYIGFKPIYDHFTIKGTILWNISDYKTVTNHTLRVDGIFIVLDYPHLVLKYYKATIYASLDTSQIERA